MQPFPEIPYSIDNRTMFYNISPENQWLSLQLRTETENALYINAETEAGANNIFKISSIFMGTREVFSLDKIRMPNIEIVNDYFLDILYKLDTRYPKAKDRDIHIFVAKIDIELIRGTKQEHFTNYITVWAYKKNLKPDDALNIIHERLAKAIVNIMP